MAEVTPPLFLDTDSFYGADEFGLPYRDLTGEGVLGFTDLRVTQRGAGANMSVDVSSGACWIMGDTNAAAQPQYRCRSDGTVNLAIAAADATNPRIDVVVAEVLDATFVGVSKLWRLRVITGTPTGGATLDNRTGAGATPDTAIVLADVLVVALDTSITDAEIRDRRPFGQEGVVPPLLTDVDMVAFVPAPGLAVSAGNWHNQAQGMDLRQSAALMYLPRRIVGATRIRWCYMHGTDAADGNYALGIFDASGRRIVDTGSIAYTGAANSFQERSETITATTFEAGWYYVFAGVDFTATGDVHFLGARFQIASTTNFSAIARNHGFVSTSGGVTVPTTLLSMTDIVATTGNFPGVPVVALSVG